MYNNVLIESNLVQKYGMGVGGYLLRWGVTDDKGRAFYQDTNFHLDWYGYYPILFSHGQNPQVELQKVGTIYDVRKTASGLSVFGMLDPENEWYEAICVMVDRKELVWEAAPSQHLVRHNDTEWIHFPISEFSLKSIAKPEGEVINELLGIDNPDGDNIKGETVEEATPKEG